jgi:hypothetical protein
MNNMAINKVKFLLKGTGIIIPIASKNPPQ